MTTPSEAGLKDWLSTLSNWGRWGEADDVGTLNYIGAEQRAAAARLVTGESVVSCALPLDLDTLVPPVDLTLDPHDPVWQRPGRMIIQDGRAAADGEVRHSAYDGFLLAPHGPNMTHIDAPSHTVYRGTIYNGHSPASDFADTSAGSIGVLRNGVFARAVLLDVPLARGVQSLEPGDAVMPSDLEACEAGQGVQAQSGDVLYVRTGYRRYAPNGAPRRFAPRPGLHATCLPWLHERQIAVIGSDVAIDVIPHGYELGLPIHTIGMWAMGLWLIDNCALETLADACRSLSRWAFAASLAPLAFLQGTGSPLNPLALF